MIKDRYILQGREGYLIDLWQGRPSWSFRPDDALLTGCCWADWHTAAEKLKTVAATLGDLWLADVRFLGDPDPETGHTVWTAIRSCRTSPAALRVAESVLGSEQEAGPLALRQPQT